MTEKEAKKVNQEYTEKSSSMTQEDLANVIQKRERAFALLAKIGEKAKDFKLLWNLMIDYKNGTYTEVPWKLIGSIVFAFVYLISPVDVIPDFIPFIGQADDIAVFGLVLTSFSSDIEKYKNWKQNN